MRVERKARRESVKARRRSTAAAAAGRRSGTASFEGPLPPLAHHDLAAAEEEDWNKAAETLVLADTDRSGKLSYKEFLVWWRTHSIKNGFRDKLRVAGYRTFLLRSVQDCSKFVFFSNCTCA